MDHSETPKSMGILSAMREAWQADRTPYYGDIQFLDTAEEAIEVRNADPKACTLVYGDPLNPRVNDFGVTVQQSRVGGMSRYIVYHTRAYEAALSWYVDAKKADPKCKLSEPKVGNFPAQFIGDFAVVSKSHLGSLGDYERDDTKRAQKLKGNRVPEMKDADYCISIVDHPWCKSDDYEGQSASFARFADFIEKFERWLILATCSEPGIGDALLASISRRFETIADKGIVSAGVRLSPEEHARYKSVVRDIKRAALFAARPALANAGTQDIQDELDVAPLVITHANIQLVPARIVIDVAREVQSASSTRRVVCDLSKIKSQTAMGGFMIPLKAKVFGGGCHLDDVKKAITSGEPRDAYARKFQSEEVVTTMIDQRQYYFPPPRMFMFEPDPSSGNMNMVMAPTEPVPGHAGNTAVQYKDIKPGTVVCMTFVPRFAPFKDCPVNIGLTWSRLLAIHAPEQLAPGFRYAAKNEASVVLAMNPLLLYNASSASSTSSETVPVPQIPPPLEVEEPVLGKRESVEGDRYTPATKKFTFVIPQEDDY